MASRGFLIRFIDIGLIVLFGFLMISDIEMSSRVDLAGSGELPEEPPVEEERRAFLVVEVTADGRYWVTDSNAIEAEVRVANSPDELTRLLRDGRSVHQAAALETVVLIQPDPASLVQFTVDVLDVCDRLRLAKSLRMDIDVEAPPVTGTAVEADSGVGR